MPNHPFSEHEPRSEEQAVEAASFILSLRARGIRDTAILRAMELVPREIFAPRRFHDLARSDVALPLPCGQTMTAPGTVAAMLVALRVQPGQRVLEIGTGSGYITALLSQLGADVHSIERFGTLAQGAAQVLKLTNGTGRARIEIGDGLAQRPRERFDRILLNGALPALPATVTSLLGPGGRLVGALTTDGVPRLMQVERQDDGELQQKSGSIVRIAPLVAGVASTL